MHTQENIGWDKTYTDELLFAYKCLRYADLKAGKVFVSGLGRNGVPYYSSWIRETFFTRVAFLLVE
jgi:hypothetical protein